MTMRALLFTVFCLIACGLDAQEYKSRINYQVEFGDTSQLHQLILIDYSKLLGTAIGVKADTLYFRIRSANEVSAVPLWDLRYLGVLTVTDSPGAGFRYAGTPPFTDLTYERTAFPLKGKGQLRIINLIYSVAEWNVNDNLQIGVGVAGPLGVLATQKVRFSITPDVHLGVTGQELWVPLIGAFNGGFTMVGDVAAVVTLGNERRFANFGTGILFNTDDPDSPQPIHRFALGGKIGPRWHAYGEFVAILDEPGRFNSLRLVPTFNASLGIRRHRWQFGVGTVFLDEDNFFPPPLPYVGYAYYW